MSVVPPAVANPNAVGVPASLGLRGYEVSFCMVASVPDPLKFQRREQAATWPDNEMALNARGPVGPVDFLAFLLATLLAALSLRPKVATNRLGGGGNVMGLGGVTSSPIGQWACLFRGL